jgi:hypothetical protein
MRVRIFVAGLGRVHAQSLCALLRSVPGPFTFESGGQLARLGDPDLDGYRYSDEAFSRLVKPHIKDLEVAAVVTGVRIEGNFFTRSRVNELIITTFSEADDLLKRSGRSAEEYAALAILQELVSFAFQRASGLQWSHLFHQDPRGCLFVFAGVKVQKLAKLSSCSVCDECLGYLARQNVDDRVKEYLRMLLRRIRRPTLRQALRLCVTEPALTFLYGGLIMGTAINVYSAALMTETALTSAQRIIVPASCVVVLAFPFFVLLWLHGREVLQRIR